MPVRITWLGHASVLIEYNSTTVFIDPWKTGAELLVADCILITHEHYDHYSEADIERLSSADTRVVAPMAAALVTDRIAAGEVLDLGALQVEAVPAYNLAKEYHPRERGWLGYIVTIGGQRIYHAGDTDVIPEMHGLEPDVALLPVGGTYTMSAGEALAAIADLQPGMVIPIHYGDIVGSRADAQRLKDGSDAMVVILEAGEVYEVR